MLQLPSVAGHSSGIHICQLGEPPRIDELNSRALGLEKLLRGVSGGRVTAKKILFPLRRDPPLDVLTEIIPVLRGWQSRPGRPIVSFFAGRLSDAR